MPDTETVFIFNIRMPNDNALPRQGVVGRGWVSGGAAAQHREGDGLGLGGGHLARHRLAASDELGNQYVGFGVGTSATVLEMQAGVLGQVGHEILRVIPGHEAAQGHDFHESVRGLFDCCLVFGGIDWLHIVPTQRA